MLVFSGFVAEGHRPSITCRGCQQCSAGIRPRRPEPLCTLHNGKRQVMAEGLVQLRNMMMLC
jgi:hypothetical protein